MRIIFLFLVISFGGAQAWADDLPVNQKPFGLWLAEFKKEAADAGVSQATLTQAFKDVSPVERIVELDRKQPESTVTLDEYLAKTVTERRIEQGKELLAENQEILDKISAEYDVEPEFIVALWGIETSFGNNTGNYDVFESLATLAYDGRRSEFFRGELLKALQIADADHIDTADMQGSWAGAMGQCQFMPSSFLNFAVDFDGDGKRDIWNTEADVFASIANYLHRSGWEKNAGGDAHRKVLLKWNRSIYFVTAVSQLAEAIRKEV